MGIYCINWLTKETQMRKSKIDDVVVTLINKQFELAGYELTYNDVAGRKDDWYNQYTITEEKYYEWLEFGEKLIRKKLKLSTIKCKNEMAMVGLMYGLKFRDDKQPV